MNVKKLESLLKDYKSKLARLDTETLKQVTQNHATAQQYAERGIGVIERENLNDKYIETIANEMQSIASMLLKERSDYLA